MGFITGTYNTTVYLSNFGAQDPFTVTGSGLVSVSGGPGIVGTAGYVWQVLNLGTVASSGGSGFGIDLTAGGSVTNGQSGSAGGLISGSSDGIEIANGVGTVSNFGSIGGASYGVFLAGGGTVANSGVITGGVDINGVGTLTNSGSIGGGGFRAVSISSGTAINSGTISGGVYANVVSNSGVITSSNYGVRINSGSGGRLTNTGTITGGVREIYSGDVLNNSGKITGAVNMSTGVGGGTLLNSGAISGNVSGFQVTNSGTGKITGTITGYAINNAATIIGGVSLTNAAGNVMNTGTIAGGTAIAFGNTGTAAQTVVNFGTITGGVSFNSGPDLLVLEPGSVLGGALSGFRFVDTIDLAQIAATTAVFSNGTLSVYNGATVVDTLLVAGAFSSNSFAVSSDQHGGVDINLRQLPFITGTYNTTVYLSNFGAQDPFTVTGSGLVSVSGGPGIVGTAGYVWQVLNLGTVASSGGSGFGIDLTAGGSVTNGQSGSAGGLISGSSDGIEIANGVGTVSNFGSIGGASYGVFLAGGGTVANSGVITGGVDINGVGTLTNSGSIGGGGFRAVSISSGTAINSGTISGGVYANVVSNSGVITSSNYGVRINSGSGGRLTNTGTITGGVREIYSGDVLNNSGKITGAVNMSTGVGGGTLLNSGAISGNVSGFQVTNSGTGKITGTITGYAINNAATIIGGVSLTNAAGNVMNTGTIAGGTAIAFGNTGTAAQTVVNFGTITGGVSFNSGPDLLVLEPGSVLGGALSGFRFVDTIDLAQIAATTAVFSNGTLSVYNGATVVDTLLVAGAFSSNSFAVSSDQHGGVDINLRQLPFITGTYNTTVYLSNFGAQDPFTVTGSGLVSVSGGPGIVGTAGYVWQVLNLGTVASSGGSGFGIDLTAGGSVTNGQSGSAGGLISGSSDGIEIANGVGTVSNFGSIGGASYGVFLAGGGTVANSGVITGGVDINGVGTLTNSGSIGGGGFRAVSISSGTAINSGTISGGVYANVVSNSGVITSSNYGVRINSGSGGRLTNTGTITGGVREIYSGDVLNNSGKITGAVNMSTGVGGGTLLNSGAISGNVSGFQVTNSGTGKITGTITGYAINNAATIIGGVSLTNAAGNVMNTGTIAGGTAIAFGNTGTAAQTVVNFGTITGGVSFNSGPDLLVLEPGSVLGGALSGFRFVDTIDLAQIAATTAVFSNGTLSVYNGATVVDTLLVAGAFSSNSFAVSSDQHGGVDINLSVPGRVLPGTYGSTIVLTGPNADTTVTASGVITAPSGPGVVNAAGVIGTLTNMGKVTATGVAGQGVYFSDGGIVTNSGTIRGGSGVVIATGNSATVTNSGTIAGTAGTAVSLGGGTNRLILAPGAVLQGKADGGGGKSVVEVTAAAGGLGGAADTAAAVYISVGSVTNFSILQVDSGAATDADGNLTFDTLINQGTINVLATDSIVVGTVAGAATGGTIDLKSGSSVHFTGAVAANQTVLFRPPGGTVAIDQPKQFAAAISQFAATDTIDLPMGTASFQQYAGGVLSLSYNGQAVSLQLATTAVTPQFQFTPDGHGGTDIFVSDACFCRGTLILTDRGEVPVENLAVGERVRTLSGAVKPIVWIGIGRNLVTRANRLARPVIVRQNALADGVPHRDLYLTHGHALYLDSAIGGVLIPVENLINHRSILWDERARVVEFFHIELEDHDVVLANGAPAESYYDASNRVQFHNTRPGSISGEAQPTIAPVLNGGPVVERAWATLFERSGGRIASDTSDDPDLHLVVNHRRVEPIAIEDGSYSFALAGPPKGELLICSRSGVPSLVGVTAHDHRRLGVALARIVISQPGAMTVIESDAPALLAGGCHPPEAGYSWTDGELALPPNLFAHLSGRFTVAVEIERPGMRYPLRAALADAA